MTTRLASAYRTHHCGQLRGDHAGQEVRLSGWVHRKRDHGGVLFVDLRDHHGITQVVAGAGTGALATLEATRLESVVQVAGEVALRPGDTANDDLPTGAIEVRARDVVILSAAQELPIPVAGEADYPEDMRLTYRFLDLRRERLHANIMLRSAVIADLRERMHAGGFTELQTPILTASSPEGARDFLVPSRLHPGRFYALPQAPQMFKQLAMVAGFDRYFQIAPCFRDEDARADRSPGEFYQLDFEMSFVEQDDVFAAIEPVLHGCFERFAGHRRARPWGVTPPPFPRIPYAEAMLRYGSDKPDLRNPLLIEDVSDLFEGSGFGLFSRIVGEGGAIRAVPAPGAGARPRSFFDQMQDWARAEGFGGLGYVGWKGGEPQGPIARNLEPDRLAELRQRLAPGDDDAVFFAAGPLAGAARLAGLARNRLGDLLGLVERDSFRFCWIVDFPMYERDEATGAIQFSHNPFSMPQGGLEALRTTDPLDILAWQYDVVVNGVELSSGAIRNHRPEIMYEAFAIAGYSREQVEREFPGMIRALSFGAPPHGGSAPGVDRIVMLLADEPNLREVVLFPMNQRAEDLMMGAPGPVTDRQLKELHIRPALPGGGTAA